jgi:malonyl-CoA O-methyltransferase
VTTAAVPPTQPASGAVRRAFDRLSRRFDQAAWLHDEVRERLLARLEPLLVAPARVLDLGCATGRGSLALAARYPGAEVLAIDASLRMCEQAAVACRTMPNVRVIAAAAEALPLPDAESDLVFANLLLPWCAPDRVLVECARVLRPGGAVVLSTLGPDSLLELRRAWAAVDRGSHVQPFLDMHDLGDLLLAAGLADPVVDVDRLSLSYGSPQQLLGELRAMGVRNAWPTRAPTLTGRHRWQRFVAALAGSSRNGRSALTLELVFGHAWKAERTPARDGGEFAFPLERLGRRR